MRKTSKKILKFILSKRNCIDSNRLRMRTWTFDFMETSFSNSFKQYDPCSPGLNKTRSSNKFKGNIIVSKQFRNTDNRRKKTLNIIKKASLCEY